ncbi:MAG: ATP-binding cassette domain-containing protein [Candidatus Koribacter versatilis]|uniref:ATP-binding cassette domain-containing protein n=1 Tax=Candidatus Korobacter versatilis TaxID=658062 RepID=A0A932EPZ8_9BACT|nr:ATP-binding cassette domain-containing protein [Candidatus Koribacter versatilis]
MNPVELKSVRKCYDQFVAVDDLSFVIPAGQIFGLLGPNGAGKTSTIRMMLGITIPDSGEVRLFGEPFRRELLHRVGYLPEERGLYKKMKVGEHLIFLAELTGLDRAEAAKRARHWCERMEIASWMDKKVEELSKGMQQKVQFVATILHDPEFIVMDEPFAGLDPVNAKLLLDVLLELRKSGKTILFSTHRMDTVERLCDSICLINRGQAVLAGDLKQIKARYGRNNVQIACEGDGAALGFLKQNPLAKSVNDYGNYVEVALAPGADAQQLLQQVASRAKVQKFEMVEPSLEEIFIDVVGKDGESDGAARDARKEKANA